MLRNDPEQRRTWRERNPLRSPCLVRPVGSHRRFWRSSRRSSSRTCSSMSFRPQLERVRNPCRRAVFRSHSFSSGSNSIIRNVRRGAAAGAFFSIFSQYKLLTKSIQNQYNRRVKRSCRPHRNRPKRGKQNEIDPSHRDQLSRP